MPAKTPLVGAVDTDDTAWVVGDVLDFPASGAFTVQCGTEWVRVTAGAGTTGWTVTRGYNSTTAAAHASGDAVSLVEDTYTNRAQILIRLPSIKEVDYAWIDSCCDAANDWISDELQFFYGPTTDTQRTFDLDYPTSRIRIPGGIRSLTSLETAPYDGSTYITATVADILLRPSILPPDGAYRELVVRDYATGAVTYYPAGTAAVRVTGALGPLAVPPRLKDLADTLVTRMHQARQSGQSDVVGQDQMGRAVVSRFVSRRDYETLEKARHAWFGASALFA